MKAPRGLTAEEAALWAKVAQSVTPLHRNPPPRGEGDHAKHGGGAGAASNSHPKAVLPARPKAPLAKPSARPSVPLHRPADGPPPRSGEDLGGLDSHWERRLSRAPEPDFTLDLHGHNLEQAHRRLDHGLTQAKAMGARLVLLITGKPRPVDAADRGERRGAIRAKILDWLAAGPHGADIAAVRNAHRRHGGEGALYLVLKRRRG